MSLRPNLPPAARPIVVLVCCFVVVCVAGVFVQAATPAGGEDAFGLHPRLARHSLLLVLLTVVVFPGVLLALRSQMLARIPADVAALGLLALLVGLNFAVFGSSPARGAYRWIQIGGLSFHPAEVTKFLFPWSAFVFLCAKPSDRVARGLFLVLTVLLLVALISQGDFSAIALTVSNTCIGICLLLPWRKAVVGVAAATLLLGSSAIADESVRHRWRDLSNAAQDDSMETQAALALRAVREAPWNVTDTGRGQVRLPEAHNDLAFARFVQVFGKGLGLMLLLAWALFVDETLRIAGRDRASPGVLAGATYLATSTGAHLASNLSLIPLAGTPAPEFSYGGSAMLCGFLALAVLVNEGHRVERWSSGRFSGMRVVVATAFGLGLLRLVGIT